MRRWCSRHAHHKFCRPARPLCRWRREEQAAKYGVCTCGLAFFPHRRGWCQSGRAAEYMNRRAYGESPTEVALTDAEREVFAFFDHPPRD